MNAKLTAALLLSLTAIGPAFAWPGGGRGGGSTGKSTGGPVQVQGYTKKDGTYVQPHTRALPGARMTVPAGPPLVARATTPSGRTSLSPKSNVSVGGEEELFDEPATEPEKLAPTPAKATVDPLPVVNLVPVAGRVTIAFQEGDLYLYEEWSPVKPEQAVGLVRDGKVVVFSAGFPVVVVKRYSGGLVQIRGTYGRMKDRVAFTRAAHLPPVDPFAK